MLRVGSCGSSQLRKPVVMGWSTVLLSSCRSKGNVYVPSLFLYPKNDVISPSPNEVTEPFKNIPDILNPSVFGLRPFGCYRIRKGISEVLILQRR